MSLFISNFRAESRVLLTIAATVLAGEATLRLGASRLSLDLRHLETIPSIAARVRAQPAASVLFLGNSLTRNGVHLETVENQFRFAGLPSASLYKVMPDDTAIEDWYYLFKGAFLETGAIPHIVVVGFALDQLGDSIPVSPERIASYGGFRHAAEFFSADLPGFGDRCDYLLSSLLFSFSERDRVRLRFLDAVVPGYRVSAPAFNAALRRHVAAGAAHSHPRFLRLRRFLSACHSAGVVPFFVAMPVPGSYPLDPELVNVISAQRGVLMDLRQIDGLQPSHFPDGYHLGAHGAALYSRVLAARLAGSFLEARLLASRPVQPAPAHLP